jgi:hypothetical protein
MSSMTMSMSARSACAPACRPMPTNGWSVGFYPLAHRGEREDGTAPDFFRARVDFGAAWSRLLPKITDADLAEYRRERAHAAWKYRMWETGCKLPTQVASGRSRCFCGAEIDIAGTEGHVYAAHIAPEKAAR